jgi:hypothetical protein
VNIQTDTVTPSSSRTESWVLAGVVAVILVVSGFAIGERRVDEAPQRLFDWQISSFYDLNPIDQAVYNALSTASEDLWLIHGDILAFGDEEQRKDPWPTVEQLMSDEFLLPPFVKDAAWLQQGEPKWTRVASFSFEGSTVYFGPGGTSPGQSAYLLVLSHVHKGASYTNGGTVWIHPNPNVAAPQTVTRDSLILNGWKEVVPYSGAMEVDRLKGP